MALRTTRCETDGSEGSPDMSIQPMPFVCFVYLQHSRSMSAIWYRQPSRPNSSFTSNKNDASWRNPSQYRAVSEPAKYRLCSLLVARLAFGKVRMVLKDRINLNHQRYHWLSTSKNALSFAVPSFMFVSAANSTPSPIPSANSSGQETFHSLHAAFLAPEEHVPHPPVTSQQPAQPSRGSC